MPDVDLLITLLPVAFALHNLEETMGMEKWTHSLKSPLIGTVTTLQFGTAAAIFTVLGFTIIPGRDFIGNESVYFRIVAGFTGMLCLNVLFPHVLASLYYRRYAPGVFTAVLINLPLTLAILFRMHVAGTLPLSELIKSVVIGGFIGIMLAFTFLRFGKMLTR